jgi:hypothetical protein
VLQDLAQGRWRSLLRMALGGAPGLALLLVANYKVTGSPFMLPYTHVASHVDTTGFFGMSVPSLEALWGLLFSFYRGLFTHAPVAIMGVVVLLVLQPRTA